MDGYSGAKSYIPPLNRPAQFLRDKKKDNSDAQYASFRDNFLTLAALFVGHVSLRRLFTAVYPPKSDATSRLARRVTFDLFFVFCFLIGLHGFNTIKILFILILNYVFAKTLGGTQALAPATWLFNVGVLFLNEWYDGYRFGDIHDIAAPLVLADPLNPHLTFSCFGQGD
jgi:protein-cysteine N-palmitoyltransferase HHAT